MTKTISAAPSKRFLKRGALVVALAVATATLTQVLPAFAVNEPVFVGATPGNNAVVHAAAATSITATFDRPLKDPTSPAPTSSFTLKDKTGTPVTGTLTRDPVEQLNFAPGQALTEAASPYSVTVTAYPETIGDPTIVPFSFSIDDTAPAMPTITVPANSSLTKAQPVHVIGTTEPNLTVSVYEGVDLLAQGTADGTGAFDITLSYGIENGIPHTIKTKVTDFAQNTGTERVVSFTHDSEAPAAPAITTPATNISTSAASVTLGGTTAENGTVTVMDGSTTIGTTTATGNAWSFTTPTLSEATHVFTAKVTDAAGNTSALSANRIVTVDRTAPRVPTLSVTPLPINAANAAALAAAGKAEPGTTVTLSVDDAGNTATPAITRTTSALPDGELPGGANYSIGAINVTSLGDGALTFTLTSRDAASNANSISPIFTKDTLAPATPVVALNLDPITSANQAAITAAGTGEPGTTIALTVSSSGTPVTTTGVVAANGTYSIVFDATSLADGTVTASVVLTDAAGNASAAGTDTALKDATAPGAPTILTPAANTVVRSNNVTLTGAGEIAGVAEAFEGDVLLGSATVANDGSWSIPITVTGDGNHTITARQRDSVGNQGLDLASRTFFLDVVAPTLVSTDPANGAVSSSIPNVKATYSEGLSLGSIQVANRVGTIVDGSTSLVDATMTWTPTQALLETASPFTATTQATDNGGSNSASTAFSFNIDATAPAAPTITAPAANASLSNPSVVISGTAEAASVVTVREGTAVLGSIPADGAGAWSITKSMGNGSHTIGVSAVDAAGNLSGTAARTFSVTADTVAPGAPVIASPTQGATLNNALVTISGSTEPSAVVRVTEGVTQVAQTTATTSGSWSTTATFALGAHSIKATATDGVGNVSVQTVARAFTISNDFTPPSVPTITSPAQNAVSGTIVSFAGTAEPGATVRLKEGATEVANAVAGNSGAWSTTASVTDGSHSVVATATDPSGNPSDPTAARAFVVDSTKPKATITTANNTVFLPLDGMTFDGTATDNRGVASVQLTVRDARSNQALVLTATLTTAGNTAVTWTASTTETLLPGRYTVTAKATDVAGLASPTSAAIGFFTIGV